MKEFVKVEGSKEKWIRYGSLKEMLTDLTTTHREDGQSRGHLTQQGVKKHEHKNRAKNNCGGN